MIMLALVRDEDDDELCDESIGGDNGALLLLRKPLLLLLLGDTKLLPPPPPNACVTVCGAAKPNSVPMRAAFVFGLPPLPPLEPSILLGLLYVRNF